MNGPFGLPGSSSTQALERQLRRGWLPRGWIAGLIPANDTTDATNDVVFPPGDCRSSYHIVDGSYISSESRDQVDLSLPVAIIKQLDVPWAPENYDGDIHPAQGSGGRSGGRSSAALADGTWHAFVIGGGCFQPDVIFHNSVTPSSVAAILPSGYNAWRRVGSPVRSTSILPFSQDGDQVLWGTYKADVSAVSVSSTSSLHTLTVPTGIKVRAIISANSPDTDGDVIAIFSPDKTDEAISIAGNVQILANPATGGIRQPIELPVRTNTSGQVRARSNTGASILNINTFGYFDSRDRDL